MCVVRTGVSWLVLCSREQALGAGCVAWGVWGGTDDSGWAAPALMQVWQHESCFRVTCGCRDSWFESVAGQRATCGRMSTVPSHLAGSQAERAIRRAPRRSLLDTSYQFRPAPWATSVEGVPVPLLQRRCHRHSPHYRTVMLAHHRRQLGSSAGAARPPTPMQRQQQRCRRHKRAQQRDVPRARCSAAGQQQQQLSSGPPAQPQRQHAATSSTLSSSRLQGQLLARPQRTLPQGGQQQLLAPPQQQQPRRSRVVLDDADSRLAAFDALVVQVRACLAVPVACRPASTHAALPRVCECLAGRACVSGSCVMVLPLPPPPPRP
jgi:hypothetical protein